MKKSTEHYREVKNYIHNELSLGRDEIKEMLREVVKEEIQEFWRHNGIERIFNNTIHSELRKNFGDYSRTSVLSFIMEELKAHWEFELKRKED